jgi:hypothetical protein
MKSLFLFMTCAAMIAGSANYDGRFSDEAAAKAEAMAQAAEHLSLLPLQIGPWQGDERPVADEEAMRRGGAVRYLYRTYKLAAADETINVLLLCGKPGPLSVHTPEVCTAGVNYAADPNQRKWSPAADAEFTWQTFSSRVDGRPNLEIAWAWSTDGRWLSPQVPRLTFGLEPFLYKLYLVRSCNRESAPSPSMNRLLADLVPAMRNSVFDVQPKNANDSSLKIPTDRTESRSTPLSPPRDKRTGSILGGQSRG